MSSVITLLPFFLLLNLVEGGNVLVMCPVSSPSHKNTMIPVFTGLAERGHKVTVVSSLKSPAHPNIRDIIPFNDFDYFPNLSAMQLRRLGVWGLAAFDYSFTLAFCESVYKNSEFMALLNEKFDLIIMDATFNECLMGFAYKLGAPLALVSPLPLYNPLAVHVGNRLPPSYVPEILAVLTDRMSFFERVYNVFLDFLMYWGARRPYPSHESIYRKYLGEDVPRIDQILANLSLILSNSHFSFNFPRPALPDVVEIGGAHCRPGRPLSKELEEFVNGAKDGLILFSLGSIVKPHEMPEETRKAFVNVFGRLKQRVLWKWPKDMPDRPNNVMLTKWIPQQDVLAHPNTRLFLTHSGLLSTQEAIYHGVPMVSIPIFGDQDLNAFLAKEAGFAETIEIMDVTEETIERAIKQVLHNHTYTERIQQVSSYFRDQPQSPKERAVFWAEYVMRHNGAQHMRSAARNLNFFQYYCLDVAGFLMTAAAMVTTTLYLLVRLVLHKLLIKSRSPNIKKAQ